MSNTVLTSMVLKEELLCTIISYFFQCNTDISNLYLSWFYSSSQRKSIGKTKCMGKKKTKTFYQAWFSWRRWRTRVSHWVLLMPSEVVWRKKFSPFWFTLWKKSRFYFIELYSSVPNLTIICLRFRPHFFAASILSCLHCFLYQFSFRYGSIYFSTPGLIPGPILHGCRLQIKMDCPPPVPRQAVHSYSPTWAVQMFHKD